MIIRDLLSLSTEQLQSMAVEGDRVKEVQYHQGDTQPYRVWLFSGKCLLAKGHDRFESLNLNAFKPVPRRPRRYGECGSTID